MSISLDPIDLFLVIKSKEIITFPTGMFITVVYKKTSQIFSQMSNRGFIKSQNIYIIEYLSVTKNHVFEKN